MRYLYVIFIAVLLSCKPTVKQLNAQEIIDKTMLASGADKVANSEIKFNFRGIDYISLRNNGNYTLTRKNDSVTDVLSNISFKRLINDKEIIVEDSTANNFKNSVNSVHYFSVLPFGLNDEAVIKKLLPSGIINGKEYYKIEISFSENGGGEDFDDVFIYWINKKEFLIDYLAYSYHTNGGGKRFRVLKEQCSKNGIRFVDYHNYKPLDKTISLTNLDKGFENNQLKKVSEIVLKDIEVAILSK
jgi:hypothetical protein